MTPQQIDAMKQALEALQGLIKKTSGQSIYSFMETERRIAMSACVFIKEALADHAMRETQRLGQEIEQEPVAHLWKCLGRWSAYLVSNGEQADCAPPSWLVDAVNNATAPPQRKPLTYCQECMRPNPIDGSDCAHGIKETK